MTGRIARVRWAAHAQEMVAHLASVYKNSVAEHDCFLACGGGKLYPAHRVVLAMASPFFRTIFNTNPVTNVNPIIVLDGVQADQVEALLQYIYSGSALVKCDNLASLCSTAKALSIKEFPSLEMAPPVKRSHNSEVDIVEIDYPTYGSLNSEAGKYTKIHNTTKKIRVDSGSPLPRRELGVHPRSASGSDERGSLASSDTYRNIQNSHGFSKLQTALRPEENRGNTIRRKSIESNIKKEPEPELIDVCSVSDEEHPRDDLLRAPRTGPPTYPPMNQTTPISRFREASPQPFQPPAYHNSLVRSQNISPVNQCLSQLNPFPSQLNKNSLHLYSAPTQHNHLSPGRAQQYALKYLPPLHPKDLPVHVNKNHFHRTQATSGINQLHAVINHSSSHVTQPLIRNGQSSPNRISSSENRTNQSSENRTIHTSENRAINSSKNFPNKSSDNRTIQSSDSRYDQLSQTNAIQIAEYPNIHSPQSENKTLLLSQYSSESVQPSTTTIQPSQLENKTKQSSESEDKSFQLSEIENKTLESDKEHSESSESENKNEESFKSEYRSTQSSQHESRNTKPSDSENKSSPSNQSNTKQLQSSAIENQASKSAQHSEGAIEKAPLQRTCNVRMVDNDQDPKASEKSTDQHLVSSNISKGPFPKYLPRGVSSSVSPQPVQYRTEDSSDRRPSSLPSSFLEQTVVKEPVPPSSFASCLPSSSMLPSALPLERHGTASASAVHPVVVKPIPRPSMGQPVNAHHFLYPKRLPSPHELRNSTTDLNGRQVEAMTKESEKRKFANMSLLEQPIVRVKKLENIENNKYQIRVKDYNEIHRVKEDRPFIYVDELNQKNLHEFAVKHTTLLESPRHRETSLLEKHLLEDKRHLGQKRENYSVEKCYRNNPAVTITEKFPSDRNCFNGSRKFNNSHGEFPHSTKLSIRLPRNSETGDGNDDRNAAEDRPKDGSLRCRFSVNKKSSSWSFVLPDNPQTTNTQTFYTKNAVIKNHASKSGVDVIPYRRSVPADETGTKIPSATIEEYHEGDQSPPSRFLPSSVTAASVTWNNGELREKNEMADGISMGSPEETNSDPLLSKISTTKRKRVRGPKSWEYLLRLLRDPTTNPSLIRWENEVEGVFRLVKPDAIALRWGKRTGKHFTEMLSYENFARGLRYHYVTGALTAVSERCFVYKFGPKAEKLLKDSDNIESNIA